MAITISTQPFKFSPSGNPLYWGLTSDNNNIKYFRVGVYESTTNGLIGTYDFYTTPDTPLSSYANLQTILNSYVSWQYKDYVTNLIDTFTNVLEYYLVITERLSSSGTISDGVTLTSTDSYVYGGKMDRITFQSYRQSQYLVSDDRTIRFLTSKPNYSKVNEFSEDGLYFFNDAYSATLNVVFKAYSKTNVMLGSSFVEEVPYDADTKIYRINTSPAYLQANHSFDFDEISYYTVELQNGSSALMSELRYYYFESIQCNLTPVNIYWVNMFGMIDTYQFVNPTYSLSVERTTVTRNPYYLNDAGKVTDYTGALFNVIDEVLDTTSKESVQLNTRDLTDAENKWLSSILTSVQVILKVSDTLYVPVLASDTSITLTNKRYLTAANIKQYNFQLSDGFTPDFVIADTSTSAPSITGISGDFYVRNA